jgi:hypothetical protein
MLHIVNQARPFALLMQGSMGLDVRLLERSPGKQPTTNPESAVDSFHNFLERMLQQHNKQTLRLSEGIRPPETAPRLQQPTS